MRAIATSRDILVFQGDHGCLTVAADTLGAIGMKEGDVVKAAPELCGRMTTRVCLMETVAAGAVPFALMALTCNEREPTGALLLCGIRAELDDAGFEDIAIGGSTEDNMPTMMTALGITLLGSCVQPTWRMAQPEDGVYLLGRPYVGEAVPAHLAELPSPREIRELRLMPGIGDIIPCGSRGVAWELEVLERETGLHTIVDDDIDLALLRESAGPATCVVATAREPFERLATVVSRIGTLAPLPRAT